MAYNMQTPVLIFATCMLAVIAQAAEAPLTKNQKNEITPRSIGPPSWDENKPTYTVQSGYEGYLVPVESQWTKDIVKAAGIFGAIPILTKFIGRVALKVGVAVAVVVLVGFIINFGLCTCTSFCPIEVHHGWDRSFTVSEDQLQSAARLLSTAVNKFANVEQKSS